MRVDLPNGDCSRRANSTFPPTSAPSRLANQSITDMRRSHLKDEQTRFSGGVRHYHRSGSRSTRSWDEWVDGAGRKRGNSLSFLKILGIFLAILALGGIIVGLIIELR